MEPFIRKINGGGVGVQATVTTQVQFISAFGGGNGSIKLFYSHDHIEYAMLHNYKYFPPFKALNIPHHVYRKHMVPIDPH
jgi:hypothetical protein